jgi:hypothetical protein
MFESIVFAACRLMTAMAHDRALELYELDPRSSERPSVGCRSCLAHGAGQVRSDKVLSRTH